MSVRELQRYTAIGKYARHLADKARRETWEETVERWAGGMKTAFPAHAGLVGHLSQEFVTPMRVLPSMRGLQFGGPPMLLKNARQYNCSATNVDRLSFFGQALHLLLCGSGVGYSVQERHIRHLPGFSKARLSGRTLPKKRYVVPDTIEGWANCSHIQLTSYHARPVPGFEEWLDCDVEFVFDQIRDEGSPLSYGVGVAPGPKPLRDALARNADLLARAVAEGLTRFTDELASDYHLNGSEAVVSGGVRRSANICLFDHWSERMLAYKTGNWFEANPQRARANISMPLLRSDTSREAFERAFQYTREFGEPGFLWVDNYDVCTNPCAEIQFYPYLLASPDFAIPACYDGPVDRDTHPGQLRLSGFQLCNLTTINGRTTDSADEFLTRCEAAAEIGTFQAALTDLPYLGPVTEAIVRREALLGVSVCGMMHHPELFLDEDVLRAGAAQVLATNARMAAALGINLAARATCEKPDGNSASLLGSFSGCHPGKIRRGFRIVQANRNEAPYKYFQSVNPEACERSVWSMNGTDDVIRFCVEYEGMVEEDVTATEFLTNVRTIQQNWVNPGVNDHLNVLPGMTHSTSNTCRVRPDEWEDAGRVLYDHRAEFTGVSFLAASGDKDYAQAPFTGVLTPDELRATYPKAAVDAAIDRVTRYRGRSGDLWAACDMVLGKRTWDEAAADWICDFIREQFFGDPETAIHCLKDVFNTILHNALSGVYREVDYAAMTEARNGVRLAGEMACVGGACEL